MIDMMIEHEGKLFRPVACGAVTWSLERQGSPGKLTFSVLREGAPLFTEGDRVCLHCNGTGIFYGFIFERKTGKDHVVSVTAYDQLRYLKNKDTYQYENKTATEVIRMIAADFNLSVGDLADTGFVIGARADPDKTLFDIILNALTLTINATKQMYVLYDSYGKLTLKNIGDMKLDLLIGDRTAEDFDYSTSIDGETYNQVKVSIDNEETGKRDVYIAKHSENINAWGVLQYYHKGEKGDDGQSMADAMLAKYNHKTKKLSIKNALGDIRVRPGCLMPVVMDLGDMKLSNYLLVEKAVHSFDGALHTMDLTLRGCDFIV